jgi:DNA-binding transcriptional ArsR family regulator
MVAKKDKLNVIFFALSDPTRREILTRLAGGPKTVKELAAPLEISGPAVTKHLKVLERAGLITRVVRGRAHVLSFRPKGLEAAEDWLSYQRRFWTMHLDELEALLTAKRQKKRKKRR